jgi:TM2 domain-containing membrane protein YozV
MPMFCSSCGTQSADTAKFCEKCGAALAAPAPVAPAVDTRVRGVEAAPSASPQVATTGKNPAIALVLSLVIPGVGQFYNSDIKKGALMLVAAIIGIASAGLITIAIWIWSMVDAYQVASGKGKIW